MHPPLGIADEAHRLEAVRAYEPGPSAGAAFDDLTALAARLCDVPVALISFIDELSERFTATVGWPIDRLPRERSFSAHAIRQSEVFVVPDAAGDARFADHPLVTGEPRVRFYAATPLVTAEGQAVGVLAVIDRRPRQLSPGQRDGLRALGRQVMAQLEL